MAVLECVRGGLNVGGVVSLHGLLQTGEDPNPAANGAQRPTLKPCENNYNTDTVVVVENGAEDPLVPDESKQRFFEEMNEAGVELGVPSLCRHTPRFCVTTKSGPTGQATREH